MRWLAIIALGGLICFGARTLCTQSRGDAASGRFLGEEQVEAAREKVALKIEKRRIATRAPFAGPGDAERYFGDQRLAPGMSGYPTSHVQRIRRDVESRLARGRLERGAEPVPVVYGFQPLGPHRAGGRTRSLAIDPFDPHVMYAAGVTGGVFKSDDGGESWRPTGDSLQTLAVSAIALDPSDPSVVYAGSGEGFSGGTNFKGAGVFRSLNGGETWALLESTSNEATGGAFSYVNDIVISPSDPDVVFSATRSGVWRSDDRGENWRIVLANPWDRSGPNRSAGSLVGCTDLAIRSDADPPTVFAAMGTFVSDGLYRTEDGGENWSRLGTPADLGRPNQGRLNIDLSPTDNDTVYVLMSDNGSGGQIGQLVDVYRSVDGGDSWEARVLSSGVIEPWMLSNLVLATGCANGLTYSQGWHDAIIKVDPADPEIVWVGGIDLFRSDDGGRTFGIASYWYLEDGDENYVHADQHAIVFHPDYNGHSRRTMFVANDGGLFQTDNPRADTSAEDCLLDGPAGRLPVIEWSSMNEGFAVSQFYHGDAHPTLPVYAGGTQDNGTWRIDAAGESSWSRIFGGDGGYVAIDPTNPDIVYAEYQLFPHIMKTTDAGASWTNASNGITEADSLFIAPFTMDRNDPAVLWAGGRNVWRTSDGAENWVKANAGDGFENGGLISALHVAPGDSSSVCLGFHNGAVAISSNATASVPTWSEFGTVHGLPAGWVSSVTFDPRDHQTVYATYSTFGIGHVYITTDNGVTWRCIDGAGAASIPDIPVHWLAVRPNDSSQLFAATEIGVFASTDAGVTWSPLGAGMPNTIVESLVFRGNNSLVAFTHGRGAFETELAPLAGCEGDVDGSGDVNSADVTYVVFRLGGSGAPGAVDGDANGDGSVNSADLTHIVFRLGGCGN